MIKDVLSAGQTGRSASHKQALIGARTGFGRGRGFQIEINVVGDEKIQMAVLVVVDKSAAGVPARLGTGLMKSGLFSYVGKCAVAVVAVKRVLAVVGDEQIIVAVVIKISNAARLAPACFVFQAGTFCHVCKCAVAIVFEQMTARLLTGGEAFQPPAVDQKDVLPAVVIVIVECQTATSGFQQIFVAAFAAVNGFYRQPCFLDNIHKTDAKRCSFHGRLRTLWCGHGLGVIFSFGWSNLLGC